MRIHALLCLFFISELSYAGDTIHLLFVYGSKPKDKTESRWFGGVHGGHVSLSYQKGYISFLPAGKFHIFPKDSFHSVFETESEDRFVFDTTGSRYLIVSIPVDSVTRVRMDSIALCRIAKAPYDYAFFGMRCASAAYEMLAAAGVFPELKQANMVRKYFYPKLLRKEILSLAGQKGWPMYYRPGRKSRKWERD